MSGRPSAVHLLPDGVDRGRSGKAVLLIVPWSGTTLSVLETALGSLLAEQLASVTFAGTTWSW